MDNEFEIKFQELGVTKEEVGGLLGYDDEVPEPFAGMIDMAIHDAAELCQIRAGFSIFDDIQVEKQKGVISISDKTFSVGKIVSVQLYKSESAALIIGTVGKQVTEHARKLEADGDFLAGYILDSTASVAAAKTAEVVANKVREIAENKGQAISDVFSPGYCDWDVAEQQALFSLLSGNFCGVTLTPGFLMEPVKSVSGILGIGKGLRELGHQCNWCSDINCLYGKFRRKKINKKNK